MVKRLLDTLREQVISVEVLPAFVRAYKPLLLRNLSAEMLRGMSLFITFAFGQKSTTRTTRQGTVRSRPKHLQTPHRNGSHLIDAKPLHETADAGVGVKKIGVEMLRMYADILCTNDDKMAIQKFAKTVTNKVGSLFLGSMLRGTNENSGCSTSWLKTTQRWLL